MARVRSAVTQAQPCHLARSRGACFGWAQRWRRPTAGLSTPGTDSQASPFSPLKMTSRFWWAEASHGHSPWQA